MLAAGAASGAWLGLFVGVLLSPFTAGAGVLPILIGLVSGVGFGLASAAFRPGAAQGSVPSCRTASWSPAGMTCWVSRTPPRVAGMRNPRFHGESSKRDPIGPEGNSNSGSTEEVPR